MTTGNLPPAAASAHAGPPRAGPRRAGAPLTGSSSCWSSARWSSARWSPLTICRPRPGATGNLIVGSLWSHPVSSGTGTWLRSERDHHQDAEVDQGRVPSGGVGGGGGRCAGRCTATRPARGRAGRTAAPGSCRSPAGPRTRRRVPRSITATVVNTDPPSASRWNRLCAMCAATSSGMSA